MEQRLSAQIEARTPKRPTQIQSTPYYNNLLNLDIHVGQADNTMLQELNIVYFYDKREKLGADSMYNNS
jgi:hypothetical protein